MNKPEASRVHVQESWWARSSSVDESLVKEALGRTHWELEPDEQNAEKYDAEEQTEIASLLKWARARKFHVMMQRSWVRTC